MASQLDDVRQDLAVLRGRMARGEIDEDSYRRQRQLILDDLTAEERAEFTTATPKPVPGGLALGPSGSASSAVPTALPTLAELQLEPGTVLFQQWRILRELGRGGFGAVFEATELHLGEQHAVKVLDPGMVVRQELLGRFRREVAVMRRLVHPRIVRVYDYREDLERSQAIISMELIPGDTVKDLCAVARATGERVSFPLILVILSQALDALAAAHAQGVVHRDVTPGNVLLAGGSAAELLADPARDPQVKLVDFGIAALAEKTELSQKSRVLGTAAYVAPEILDPSAGEHGPPADVYGAGAVAYELLTGEPPLGRFVDPRDERPELTAEFEELVLAMLSRRPQERPSALTALESCGRFLDVSTAATGGNASPPSEKPIALSEPTSADQEPPISAVAPTAPEKEEVAEARKPILASRNAKIWIWVIGLLTVALIFFVSNLPRHDDEVAAFCQVVVIPAITLFLAFRYPISAWRVTAATVIPHLSSFLAFLFGTGREDYVITATIACAVNMVIVYPLARWRLWKLRELKEAKALLSSMAPKQNRQVWLWSIGVLGVALFFTAALLERIEPIFSVHVMFIPVATLVLAIIRPASGGWAAAAVVLLHLPTFLGTLASDITKKAPSWQVREAYVITAAIACAVNMIIAYLLARWRVRRLATK